MSDSSGLINELRDALNASPENLALRRQFADLLLEVGRYKEAEQSYRAALDLDPSDSSIKLSLALAFFHQGKAAVALVILERLMKADTVPSGTFLLAARAYLEGGQMEQARAAYREAIAKFPATADPDLAQQLGVAYVPPETASATDEPARVPVTLEEPDVAILADVQQATVSFKDVGGMEQIKEEIRLKIIHPLHHPEIYRAYNKQIGGGILLYGPPGCGKTHLARATAGEVNAAFISIGLHDVLDMYLGQSEQNLHQLFQLARAHTPCVLFIDEVDALGANRTDMRRSAGRQLINQFLSELDGVDFSNEGLLILAATNAPWHLDPAFRRPGRFDRVIFVPPPDAPARAAILEIMLQSKPAEEIDYGRLARKTEGFSGADLKGIVDVAVEQKLAEAMKSGKTAPITARGLLEAVKKTRPSTTEWFATARNYALYANQNGLYDDILTYLKVDKGLNPGSGLAFWRRK